MAKMTAEEHKKRPKIKLRNYIIDRICLVVGFGMVFWWVYIYLDPNSFVSVLLMLLFWVPAIFLVSIHFYLGSVFLLPLDMLIEPVTFIGYLSRIETGEANWGRLFKHTQYCSLVFYRKSDPFKSITLNIPQEGTAEEIERIEKPKQKTLYKVSYYRFSKILLSFEEADTAAGGPGDSKTGFERHGREQEPPSGANHGGTEHANENIQKIPHRFAQRTQVRHICGFGYAGNAVEYTQPCRIESEDRVRLVRYRSFPDSVRFGMRCPRF